ncbi:hypothetical protein, partial [Noviherbaspirillum aridicola]|uniref:hypothetical protein n=1 Tax=Noviherbaspirillum aridicola TaxID=2849687 RepID=UPI001C820911
RQSGILMDVHSVGFFENWGFGDFQFLKSNPNEPEQPIETSHLVRLPYNKYGSWAVECAFCFLHLVLRQCYQLHRVASLIKNRVHVQSSEYGSIFRIISRGASSLNRPASVMMSSTVNGRSACAECVEVSNMRSIAARISEEPVILVIVSVCTLSFD